MSLCFAFLNVIPQASQPAKPSQASHLLLAKLERFDTGDTHCDEARHVLGDAIAFTRHRIGNDIQRRRLEAIKQGASVRCMFRVFFYIPSVFGVSRLFLEPSGGTGPSEARTNIKCFTGLAIMVSAATPLLAKESHDAKA